MCVNVGGSVDKIQCHPQECCPPPFKQISHWGGAYQWSKAVCSMDHRDSPVSAFPAWGLQMSAIHLVCLCVF